MRKTMPILVNPVTPAQHNSFVELLTELHNYYVTPPTATESDIRTHFLNNIANQPGLCLPVAYDEGNNVLGFAALLQQYSLVEATSPQNKQCLLKELYVRTCARGRGIGRMIMKWSASYAFSSGCGRMDWNVKSSNVSGIRFYKSLGAHQVEDRFSFRLASGQLSELVKSGA